MTTDTTSGTWSIRFSALLVALTATLLIAGCGMEIGGNDTASNGTAVGALSTEGTLNGGTYLELPDRFSHDEHFSHIRGDDCTRCHQGVHGVGGAGFLPAPEICLQCHSGDMDEWAHVYHLGLGQGIACLDCHGQGAATTLTNSPVCNDCHQGDQAR